MMQISGVVLFILLGASLDKGGIPAAIASTAPDATETDGEPLLNTYAYPRLFNITYKSMRTAPIERPSHHRGSSANKQSPQPIPAPLHHLKNVKIVPHFTNSHHTGYKWMPETGPAAQTNATTSNGKSRKHRMAVDDAVSRNISILLENLLKHYEKTQLPTHGKGFPTVIKTNMLIRSMGPVSEQEMDYSMDCYFRQYWRDERLSFSANSIQSLSLSIKMLERIWRPDTYFYNGKHSHIHTITVPNKLLRLSKEGDILYSMRLTIKASCPMVLRNFPMDRQSCPLILGSYAHTNQTLQYTWETQESVSFVSGMTLSQFDLISYPQRNYSFIRREGSFSVLEVSFNLQRHTGYFLIQVYVPCILIVVLSWVSFWIHREATSDRVGLGITTVLTLSTISLDSRTDLPKVRYATALDWFLLSCFFYCIATLLQFAFVHYFTKVGSGEIPLDEDEWDDVVGETIEDIGGFISKKLDENPQRFLSARRRSSLICPVTYDLRPPVPSQLSTMERQTQTEPPRVRRWKQLWLCFVGDEKYRKQRQREATNNDGSRYINSVSSIDQFARYFFPLSFAILNLMYFLCYVTFQDDFPGVRNQNV